MKITKSKVAVVGLGLAGAFLIWNASKSADKDSASGPGSAGGSEDMPGSNDEAFPLVQYEPSYPNLGGSYDPYSIIFNMPNPNPIFDTDPSSSNNLLPVTENPPVDNGDTVNNNSISNNVTDSSIKDAIVAGSAIGVGVGTGIISDVVGKTITKEFPDLVDEVPIWDKIGKKLKEAINPDTKTVAKATGEGLEAVAEKGFKESAGGVSADVMAKVLAKTSDDFPYGIVGNTLAPMAKTVAKSIPNWAKTLKVVANYIPLIDIPIGVFLDTYFSAGSAKPISLPTAVAGNVIGEIADIGTRIAITASTLGIGAIPSNIVGTGADIVATEAFYKGMGVDSLFDLVPTADVNKTVSSVPVVSSLSMPKPEKVLEDIKAGNISVVNPSAPVSSPIIKAETKSVPSPTTIFNQSATRNYTQVYPTYTSPSITASSSAKQASAQTVPSASTSTKKETREAVGHPSQVLVKSGSGSQDWTMVDRSKAERLGWV